MTRLLRSTVTAAAAALLAVGPLAGGTSSCSPFVSGWYNGGPVSGYLIGTSTVKLTGEAAAFLGFSISQEFCVGTYQMMFRDGSTMRVKLRCDDYTVWGLF